MKLIYDPKVYLIGESVLDENVLDEFVHDHGFDEYDPHGFSSLEDIVETAGRLCYMSFKGGRPHKEYIENILESGHGSVLEHSSISFIFTGISRSLSHELVRHRAGWAYSQLSQRYVDESAAEYVVPPAMEGAVRMWVNLLDMSDARKSDRPRSLEEYAAEIGGDNGVELLQAGRNWWEGIAHAHQSYVDASNYLYSKFADEDKTMRRKRAREAARSLLPNATETKVFATANLRAIRHFIELRGSRHADAEIRKLAYHIFLKARALAPNVFADYSVNLLEDATKEIITTYRKV